MIRHFQKYFPEFWEFEIVKENNSEIGDCN